MIQPTEKVSLDVNLVIRKLEFMDRSMFSAGIVWPGVPEAIVALTNLSRKSEELRALLARCRPYVQQAHLVLDQDYANRPYDIETRQLWLDMQEAVKE